jgi:D-alanyl-D-alanine carboxypeptidase/D-alanyl-D-alanine-endopeptidase (penicillin-binding protein 4)
VRRADDRLTTRVVAGSRPGEVVLVGAGDATLSAARPGTPTPFAGAARLSDLAAQARNTSPAKITRVVVDGDRYSGPRMGPGWDPGDVGGGYVAPISALMADVGRVDPGNKAVRSPTPDLAAGRAFAARLGLPASAVARGNAKAGATVLAEVKSAPIGRLVEQMLLESDNVLAEALARQVAIAERMPVSFTGAADATRRALNRIGVPTAGLRLVDGSGLSPLDKVSPQVLVALLRTVASVDHPALHALVPGLPVGGYDGTLDERYVAGSTAIAAGSVRAKTGTLNGVSSLAGIVVDRDGRLLVFAFLADGVSGGTLPAEAALDEAATALARCGCH